MSANLAASRNPWEPSALVRDEMAIVVCNRSAAYAAAEDFLSALVDAEIVIQLKRPWSKGHFRKAKALLGLQRYDEARDAVMLGLQFEPDSAVSPMVSSSPTTLTQHHTSGDVSFQKGDRRTDRGPGRSCTLPYISSCNSLINCSWYHTGLSQGITSLRFVQRPVFPVLRYTPLDTERF